MVWEKLYWRRIPSFNLLTLILFIYSLSRIYLKIQGSPFWHPSWTILVACLIKHVTQSARYEAIRHQLQDYRINYSGSVLQKLCSILALICFQLTVERASHHSLYGLRALVWFRQIHDGRARLFMSSRHAQ